MGNKSGKKARKFAKKNRQSVLRQKRKSTSFFKKKKSPRHELGNDEAADTEATPMPGLSVQNEKIQSDSESGKPTEMENQESLKTVLPFLPLKIEHGSLVWPTEAIRSLTALSKGPRHSGVASGKEFFSAIKDIRASIFPSSPPLPSAVGLGYAHFFDKVLPREKAAKWFTEVVPVAANLLLRFPSLLMSHYKDSSNILDGVETGLRLLEEQCSGIVILSQELVAALLSCSLFCLFPTEERRNKSLPKINFGSLLGFIHQHSQESINHKMKCIVHYFESVCSCMPEGFLSFERKVVLPAQYQRADVLAQSLLPLCQFQVYKEGRIEDHKGGSLEVDFADEFLGGLIMDYDCAQEEIYFLMHPELVAGMFFLPRMSDNEAIEVIGAERFSNYSGYTSTFRFTGACTDKRERDSIGRYKTRIVAIDAVPYPSERQYQPDLLLREINKAFCGFQDQYNYQRSPKYCGSSVSRDKEEEEDRSNNAGGEQDSSCGSGKGEKNTSIWEEYKDAGVVTGNWGCGVFMGDPQLKAMLQWIAASQASRPFISYYTFNLAEVNNLEQVVQTIQSRKWRVGDLWKSVADYSSKRVKNKINSGYFAWLLHR